MNFQSIIKPIFCLIWRKRLYNYKLIKVTGWRSCIIDGGGGKRIRAEFLFEKNEEVKRPIRRLSANTANLIPRDQNDTSIIR